MRLIRLQLVLFASLLAVLVGQVHAQDLLETSVGMPKRLNDVILPGTKLEVKPIEDRKIPLVLRITQVRPEGNSFKYDFEYFGLEPGTHDLSKYLRRVDGTSVQGVPPILVKVVPVLPPGQVQPNKLQIERSPWLGGYFLLKILGITVWVLGMLLIVASFFWPRKKVKVASTYQPVSLADKLRPLVEGAVAGKLSQSELSQLERNLLALWRKKLHLENENPETAISLLRTHQEAGPLLQQLEDWLHKPNPSQNVNIEALLKPYTQMAPEALSA